MWQLAGGEEAALTTWEPGSPRNRCADFQHSPRGQQGHPVTHLMVRLLRNVPDATLERFISHKTCLNKGNISNDGPSE